VELLKNIKTIPLKLADCFSQDVTRFIKTLLVIPEDKRATWEDVFTYFTLKETPYDRQSPAKTRPFTPSNQSTLPTISSTGTIIPIPQTPTSMSSNPISPLVSNAPPSSTSS
jgi:hypothetical protein